MQAKPKIHLCLVSSQATPNVTPALDPDFRPQEVILLVCPNMEQYAEWTQEVLQPTGVKVSTWSITDPWDLEHLRERVLELLSQRDGQGIALNATGGTKLMSIAAYEIFREFEKPIFYVNPENDHVIWLYPHEWGGFDLADHVKLGPFLRMHGATISQISATKGISSARRALTAELVQGIHRFSAALRTLNWLASKAARSLSVALSAEQTRNPILADLLDRFADRGLLHIQRNQIHFQDESARFYVNGGWLEEHVFASVYGLRSELPIIQDIGQGVEVERTQKGNRIRNELDVVFLANNRLYLIECKTRSWSKQPTMDTPGSQAIYKLDTLKDLLGGIHGQAMLVSYQELHHSHRQRAQDLDIATCHGNQIRQLHDHLQRWII